MKITASVTKSSLQDCGPCYFHLPIFFLYIHYPILLQNKKFLYRPSQVACTVTTMNVTCMQATLCVHEIHAPYWFPYIKITWICQFVCLFLCPVLGWFYHVLLPVTAINCDNCQLSTGDINLSQLRTTSHPPTQTIMIQENKNNHYHSIFNIQHSSPKSLQP